MSFKSVTIFCNDVGIMKAIVRYLDYTSGISGVFCETLNHPFKQKEVVLTGEQSDFLVVDGFVREEAKGFHFARAMEKRVLLLFYPGEIEIEVEGPFWMVLPQGLERLGDKIKELMDKPAPDAEDYEKLEERFPVLREKKGHHR